LDPQAENALFNRPSEGLGDIKLTFRKFYRINGGATQLHGVVPDIIIPDRFENAKFREKDNPDALGWDEIPKASYTLWDPGYGFSSIVTQAKNQVNQNLNFKGIREIVSLLDKYRNEEVPLNIVEYKAMQAKIKEASKKLEQYSKLSSGLAVKTIAKDSLQLGSDTAKIKAQKQFFKTIGSDIYIDETVKVIDRIIGEEALVQRR
jgi:carboxyl-terminal processing protease